MGKIKAIYNSIALSRFNPNSVKRDSAREEFGIKEMNIVVGSVGKLHAGKGLFDLFSAFNLLAVKYSGLKLLYVGDGHDSPELKRKCRSF